MVEIPPRADYVSFVRLVVAAAAELAPPLSAPRVDDLRVAVSEAATNAIQAHSRTGVEAAVRVRCQRSGTEMRIMVSDEGAGFDADALPQMPPPESAERLRHESGLGLWIIKALADETVIRSSPSGTEIEITLSDQPQIADQASGQSRSARAAARP